jgi:hypothetical protein
VDEIKLFEYLQPPPPADAARMREAARARLAAATSAPLTHPLRRRSALVTVAAASALVAAGTGYGLTTAQGDSTRGIAAGLTAVHGCPGMYLAAGTLEQVSGSQLIIQPLNAADVTVATSTSTAVTRPVRESASDITDGSRVQVRGNWSGGTLVASQVGIMAVPPASSPARAPISPRARKIGPAPSQGAGSAFAIGAVVDAHDGSFTVVTQPRGLRIQVVTSSATKVVASAKASLGQLDRGANVVAVGSIGANGVLTANTVVESLLVEIETWGGTTKLPASRCSASAIATAAILAGT